MTQRGTDTAAVSRREHNYRRSSVRQEQPVRVWSRYWLHVLLLFIHTTGGLCLNTRDVDMIQVPEIKYALIKLNVIFQINTSGLI